MSIFSKIRDAIFGHKRQTVPAPTATATPGQPSAMPQMNGAAPVDVDAVLTDLASKQRETLNYKSSIVDLMKLLDLDSSLANRKELATELGYAGPIDGSAEMNIWLHKQVMAKLAVNGGTVSAELQN